MGSPQVNSNQSTLNGKFVFERIPIAVLVALLFYSLTGNAGGRGPELAPLPKAVKNQDDEMPSMFRGKVTALTDKTITIKPEGFVTTRSRRLLEDGRWDVVAVYKQDNTKPPKTFVFSKKLLFLNGVRPGGGLKGAGYGQHKISDVRLGDHVEISCNTAQKEEAICGELRILRRYGGRVPPAIGDTELPVNQQHLRVDSWRNAEQEIEEKAVATVNQTILRLLR